MRGADSAPPHFTTHTLSAEHTARRSGHGFRTQLGIGRRLIGVPGAQGPHASRGQSLSLVHAMAEPEGAVAVPALAGGEAFWTTGPVVDAGGAPASRHEVRAMIASTAEAIFIGASLSAPARAAMVW
jgi:hypothetical protein